MWDGPWSDTQVGDFIAPEELVNEVRDNQHWNPGVEPEALCRSRRDAPARWRAAALIDVMKSGDIQT